MQKQPHLLHFYFILFYFI